MESESYACRICPEVYASADERSACERRNISERVWLDNA